jgi:hypothetical protein
MSLRLIVLAYLPTIGVWSIVRAARFYRRHPNG